MKKILAPAAAVCLFALVPAAHAQTLTKSYVCAASPQSSCMYQPAVKGVAVYRLSCSNQDAKPAPLIAISNTGPVTKCDINTASTSYTDVACSINGVASDPDQIKIVATCEPKVSTPTPQPE